ncbi:galactose oxidase-like domain-containing protein [Salaquimonas pukyongi]|uniref:galactose oxidase-like domain-containing protein n=1 Tax=Salaquimonas pukyongi TaxID=2712698 RepID=UPI00096BB55C|nr:galactose oxidase-like domain-containing protein [Salaquimonas pukyongi]
MPNQTDGSWDNLQNWPLIGLHATVMDDGRVLTFGTDSRGMQGGQFIYDIYDPATGTHTTLPNTTPTDIFCSAAVIIPGTNKILIAGGDARPLGSTNRGVNDVNILDMDTGELYPAPEGDMAFQRWYPTMVALPSGQMVMLGGTDINGRGVSTPEIYTHGEGWRSLTSAVDTDLGSSSLYPRAFVADNGNIVYFATGRGNDNQVEVMSLDPSGNGALTQIGTLPFSFAWDAPAVMYEAGKVLVQDAQTGLWSMDITGDTLQFTRVGTLSQERNWSNMTTLADGTVLINGGTSNGNREAGADRTAVIWDPETNQLTYTVDEDNPRLYHSASVLLNDGTLLSLGGGAAGSAENNYLDGQVYRPPYLYDDNGNLADRPVITDTPDSVLPGDTFTISVDDASDIQKLTFVKTGAATHAFNMGTRFVELDFSATSATTLEVSLPAESGALAAGSWMLFAWDSEGVPSIAPMVNVEPRAANYDNAGDLTAEFFAIDSDATSLDDINFDGEALHIESALFISESSNGSFYNGGPADDFAVRYSGDFHVGSGGQHTFYLTSDDGSRLYIDGELVVDNDGMQAPTLATASVNLDAGTHTIEVRYFEGGGPGAIDLDWSGPGFGRKQMLFDGAEDNLVVNGSFEFPEVASSGSAFENSAVAGWTSTSGRVEVQESVDGHRASAGDQWLELDQAGAVDAVYQDIRTQSGQTYALSLDVARRPTAPGASNTVEVYWNGEQVASIDPASASWEKYSFEVVGTGGADRLEFREPASDNDGTGSLIDNVKLVSTDSGGPPEVREVQDNPAQTQYEFGTDQTDRFVIDGNSADHGWGPTEDGQGIVVWNNATGSHDLLYDFEEIAFNDRTVELGGGNPGEGLVVADDPSRTQYEFGTDQTDRFVIDGNSADHGWGATEDGQGIVVWNNATGSHDLLYDFEKIAFNDRTVELGAGGNPGEGLVVADDPSRTQYEFGTDQTDRFVIDADSAGYRWGATEDGQGIVVWNEADGSHDLLYDFEEIAFNDETVILAEVA